MAGRTLGMSKFIENQAVRVSTVAVILVGTIGTFVSALGIHAKVVEYTYTEKEARQEVTRSIKALNNRLDLEIEKLQEEVSKKRDKGLNSWTRNSMKNWATDLKEGNASLHVPDPDSLRYFDAD